MIIDRRGIEVPVDGVFPDSNLEPSAGLAIKEAARVGTTANITLNGTQTIDGIAAAEGDRVLVKNQTDATQNGIYVVSSGNWARSTDFNESNEVAQGTQVFVTLGTVNATKTFFVTTANPITIDATGIAFAAPGPSRSTRH
jgi:phage-related tail fiber protein